MGFYAVNDTSSIMFPDESKVADVCDFLGAVRAANRDASAMVVQDNIKTHKSATISSYANSLGIRLVFLLSYSSHLNPIEFIWNGVKRAISRSWFTDHGHMPSIMSRRPRDLIAHTGGTCSYGPLV